jgi:hypothetical protein
MMNQQSSTPNNELRRVRISDLAAATVLQKDVGTEDIVVRGQEITPSLMVCLENFHQSKAIPDRLGVSEPEFAGYVTLIRTRSMHLQGLN